MNTPLTPLEWSQLDESGRRTALRRSAATEAPELRSRVRELVQDVDVSLMLATNPERCACRATSATLSRDNAKPKVVGNSHASALISTVSSGGKDPRASRAGSLFEARQSLLEEALAPLADHLASGVQPRGDLVVVHAVRGHQDHLGSNNFEIRQRISAGTPT